MSTLSDLTAGECHPQKRPPSRDNGRTSKGSTAAPAAGGWDRGTEGGLIYPRMGPARLPAQGRQGPLQASSWGLEASCQGSLSTSPSSLARGRQNRGRWRGRLDAQADHSPPLSATSLPAAGQLGKPKAGLLVGGFQAGWGGAMGEGHVGAGPPRPQPQPYGPG